MLCRRVLATENERSARWLSQWSRYYELEVTFVSTKEAFKFVKELNWFQPLLSSQTEEADKQKLMTEMNSAVENFPRQISAEKADRMMIAVERRQLSNALFRNAGMPSHTNGIATSTASTGTTATTSTETPNE